MDEKIVPSGPRFHPIFDKFEPGHFTQLLELSHEDDVGE